MFALVVIRRGRLRFGWYAHGIFAMLGVLLFSTSFIAFYHASTLLASGLLAVVFSLASIVNLLIGVLCGDRAGPRRRRARFRALPRRHAVVLSRQSRSVRALPAVARR